MSRYNSSGSYNHRYRRISPNCYEISWTVDRYYAGSRLRYPQTYGRVTDEAGVIRFCKKWKLPLDKAAEIGYNENDARENAS